MNSIVRKHVKAETAVIARNECEMNNHVPYLQTKQIDVQITRKGYENEAITLTRCWL